MRGGLDPGVVAMIAGPVRERGDVEMHTPRRTMVPLHILRALRSPLIEKNGYGCIDVYLDHNA